MTGRPSCLSRIFKWLESSTRILTHHTSPPPPLFHAQVGVTLGEVCEGLSAAASERVTHAGAVAGDVRRLVRGLTEVLQGLSEAVSK